MKVVESEEVRRRGGVCEASEKEGVEFEDVGVVGRVWVVGLVREYAGFGREAAW